MMLVTIEFSLKPGMQAQFEAALDKAHACLQKYDGFLGDEPCRSLLDKNKFVTLFFFRDRESIEAWRNDVDHKRLQQMGKDEVFAWYKIRIAEIERQYGCNESKGSGLPTD